MSGPILAETPDPGPALAGPRGRRGRGEGTPDLGGLRLSAVKAVLCTASPPPPHRCQERLSHQLRQPKVSLDIAPSPLGSHVALTENHCSRAHEGSRELRKSPTLWVTKPHPWATQGMGGGDPRGRVKNSHL